MDFLLCNCLVNYPHSLCPKTIMISPVDQVDRLPLGHITDVLGWEEMPIHMADQ